MIAWFIGHLWWWLVPIRKQESIRRFKQCFPELDPRLIRRGVGVFCAQYIRLLFKQRLQCPRLPEGNAIVLAGHGGAWDMALITIAEQRPISIFLKQPSNPLVAWIISRWRQKSGVEGLKGRNILNEALEAVDQGRWLVFVQDQRLNDGIDADFFERKAKTSAGFAAAILKRPNTPVYGVWQNERTIEIERIEANIPKNKHEAILFLTKVSQQFYESKIREEPALWLWLHRRWKR